MPRPQKPLEEQLQAAEEELKKLENKVSLCKQNITSIKHQIEEKNMKEAYALLKKNNISIKQLETMLSNQKKTK